MSSKTKNSKANTNDAIKTPLDSASVASKQDLPEITDKDVEEFFSQMRTPDFQQEIKSVLEEAVIAADATEVQVCG